MAWIVGAIVLAVLASVAALGVAARAQDIAVPPVEDDEWNSDTAVWLARAQVGEGGWNALEDHDAIAWVLFRRWRDAQEEKSQHTTFARVIQQYCASLKGNSARARWLRGLSADGPPVDWPNNATWAVYKPYWEQALERAHEWADGLIEDPTGGRAMHFGSPEDPAPRGHQAVDGLRTRNIFYEPVHR